MQRAQQLSVNRLCPDNIHNQSAYSNVFQLSSAQGAHQGGNYMHTPAGLISARQTMAERQHLSVSGWNIEDADEQAQDSSIAAAQGRDGQVVTTDADHLYHEFM